MSENLKKIYSEVSNFKTVLLENNNIDLLLYLAKYNPKVSKKDLVEKFGREALKGLKDLKSISLVREDDKNNCTLTDEGIFQVDGLISFAI